MFNIISVKSGRVIWSGFKSRSAASVCMFEMESYDGHGLIGL